MLRISLTAVGATTARYRDALFPVTALALLCFTFVLRYRLSSTLSVHWDEFNFLRHVHQGLRGEHTGALQTFHIHLFRWLGAIDGTEVDQVIAARRAMFALSVVAAACMAYIGRRLIGGAAGVFAAFCVGCHSYVMIHATAFRYDGIIVTLFLLASAALLVERRRDTAAAVAGACVAVAVLVSVKATFYLPSIALIACAPIVTGGAAPRDVVRRLLILLMSAAVVGGVLFALHVSVGVADTDGAAAFAGRAADQAVDLARPFPRSSELIRSLRWDAPIWALWLLGVALLGTDREAERTTIRFRVLGVVGLTLPLLTLYVYRNAWPYFYVSIMPGACLMTGVVWHRVVSLRHRAPVVAILLLGVITVPAAWGAWLLYEHNHDEDETARQRDLLAAVHEIFPEPVPYVDRCGMVSSFPKVGPFMTSWSMDNYRQQGENIMKSLLKEEQPRMVLANVVSLQLHRSRVRGSHALRRADFQTLRANFIHHWGDVWVAGKALTAPVDETRTFQVLIGGEYTLESPEPVQIDGETVSPRQVVTLTVGKHSVRALGAAPVDIKLRTGDNLARPGREPRAGALFRGFKIKLPKKKWDLDDA